MTNNEFQLLYSIKKNGMQSCRKLHEATSLSTGFISQTLRGMRNDGLLDDSGITDKGVSELAPYKVDNAVIMAAGMSSRFIPLSLEKPKGLLEVKGDILIERQIEQLQEAGIKEIVLVLGYKKEAFFYLENKYRNIRIVINPEYNTKNNTHTLFLAQKYLGNTYICSSDDYFVENPFEEYVYQSYYAAQHVTEQTNEWYMTPDPKGNIRKVVKGGTEGDIMLGHAYWDRNFTKAMLSFINESHVSGRYDQDLWEQILLENVKSLPPMSIRVYPDGDIFEFDSLDELRSFDKKYVNNTSSTIMQNICKVLNCSEKDVKGFKTIKDGITNSSFVFDVNGSKYVYRHPEEPSSALILRKSEKQALIAAKAADIDPTFIYMDDEGWKISKYIENGRIADYSSSEDNKRVVSVLQKLHGLDVSIDRDFDPWTEACKLEDALRDISGLYDQELDSIKAKIQKCCHYCADDQIQKIFCHCDTYASNWILTDRGDTLLIDWEYAGMADPGCDVGSYIMDSGWDITEASAFIKEYCGTEYNEKLLSHYLSYTALISYYWYLWALYRESCGTVMGESLYNWRVMAIRYSNYLITKYDLQ